MAERIPNLIVVLALLLAACGSANPATTPQTESKATALGVATATEATVTIEKVAEGGGVETPTGIINTSRRSETLGH